MYTYVSHYQNPVPHRVMHLNMVKEDIVRTFTVLASCAVDAVIKLHVAWCVAVRSCRASEWYGRPDWTIVATGTLMLVRLVAGVVAVVAC